MGRDGTAPGQLAPTRVLVVEDEAPLADALSYLLGKEGFEVAVAASGPDGLAQFQRQRPGLVLLDLNLPGLSGFDVCRRIRQSSQVPVIMLTARDAEVDKVVGLEMGADDYVTKPFSARELLARVRTVLRRQPGAPAAEPEVLVAGPVRIDLARHAVCVAEAPVRLPLKEFELLEYLVRNAGRVLTRGQLMDQVWGPNYFGDTKTLDVHVKRLRSKVEPVPSQPRHLRTVRGVGFTFEP